MEKPFNPNGAPFEAEIQRLEELILADYGGGRVIDLFEEGTVQTYMVHLMELLGRGAMRDPDYFEGGCKYFIRKLP